MKLALIAIGFLLLGAVGAGTIVSVMNNKKNEPKEEKNVQVETEGVVAVDNTNTASPTSKVNDVVKAPAPAPAVAVKAAVYVNGVKLSDVQIAALEKKYSSGIAGGRYWYDTKSGAWGKEGGPTEGYLEANESIGGPLKADASGGGTGVFVNGRELHPTDVKNLNMLFAAYGTATVPGRYWVDAQGNFGIEGQLAPLGNLLAMVQALTKKSGGANSFYYKSNGSDYTTFGGGGGFSYFGSKNDYNGSSSVFVDETGVNIDYTPKSSEY